MKKIFTFLSVALLSLNVSAQSLYGDMESWASFKVGTIPSATLEAPKGWRCPDSLAYEFGFILGGASKQLFKSTDAHGGTYAAKIMTAEQGMLGMLPGIMINGVINVDVANQDFSLSGGTPIKERVNYVNAWVKYLPKGGDSATVIATAILTGRAYDGSDSVLGMAAQIIAATPAYSLISMKLDYDDPNSVPDAIQVLFTSSAEQATDSSTLFVDDVSYTVFPSGVTKANADNRVICYPNPANNVLYMKSSVSTPVTMQIMNMHGQIMNKFSFTGGKALDVSNYANGQYFYTITDDAG